MSVKIQKIATFKEINKKLQVSLLQEILDYLFFFIRVFLTVALVYLFVRDNLFRSFKVDGVSMAPRYRTGDLVYLDQISIKLGSMKRGDVVVVHRPDEYCRRGGVTKPEDVGNCFYIKRIIGLPGEQVYYENGQVHIINKEYPKGIKLDESSYLESSVRTFDKSKITNDRVDKELVQPGTFFVQGDNRPNSTDSRAFGAVPVSDIIGKEFLFNGTEFFKLPKYNIPG
jgi:signal peptidase I